MLHDPPPSAVANCTANLPCRPAPAACPAGRFAVSLVLFVLLMAFVLAEYRKLPYTPFRWACSLHAASSLQARPCLAARQPVPALKSRALRVPTLALRRGSTEQGSLQAVPHLPYPLACLPFVCRSVLNVAARLFLRTRMFATFFFLVCIVLVSSRIGCSPPCAGRQAQLFVWHERGLPRHAPWPLNRMRQLHPCPMR